MITPPHSSHRPFHVPTRVFDPQQPDWTVGATISQLPESIVFKFINPLLTLGSSSVNRVQVVDPMGMTITSPDNLVEDGVSLATLAAHAKDYVFMLHSKRYPDGDVAGALKSK